MDKEYLKELAEKGYILSTNNLLKKVHFGRIDKFEDFNNFKGLSETTIRNLKNISVIFDIDWKYIISYFPTSSSRRGFFIYGNFIKTNEIVNFHRKETTSPVSGRTVMHVNNSSINISAIIQIYDEDLKHYARKIERDNLLSLHELAQSVGSEKLVFKLY